MVRTLMYFLLGTVVLGTVLTPGLAAFALLAVPVVGLWFVWRIALTVVTRGHPTDAVVSARRNRFLGPGGPDDSFAADALDAAEVGTARAATPETASTRTNLRTGAGRRTTVPRRAPARPLPAATPVFRDEA